MVEAALYFALGFLIAAFLVILALPAVSRRSSRLANARARLLAPLSEAQARAERDALRGQHAVEIAQLRRKVAAAEWDRTVARTELARQLSRVQRLDEAAEARAKDLEAMARRYNALNQDAEALAAEVGARELGLRDLLTQRDRANAERAQALTRIGELEAVAERNRLVIASLTTQVSGLEIELADWRAKYGATPGASADPVRDLYDRLQRSEMARERLTIETGQRLKALAEREAALTKTEAALASLSERLRTLETDAKATETDLRSRLQTLSTSQAAAEGALNAERAARVERQRETDALRARLAELEATGASPAQGEVELRAAILRLGREFLNARGLDEGKGNTAAIRAREVVGD